MWPFGKSTSRRKEIRRSKVERQGAWYRRLIERLSPAWAALTIVTAACACVILNLGDEPLGVRVGQMVARGVPARTDFKIPDLTQTSERRARARDASPNYYVLEPTLLDDVRGRLTNALSIVRANKDDSEKLAQELARARLTLDDAARAHLLAITTPEEGDSYLAQVDAAINALQSRPLVEPEGAVPRRTSGTAVLVNPISGVERPVPTAQLVYANDDEGVARLLGEAANAFREPLRHSMEQSLAAVLHGGGVGGAGGIRPVYRYDSERTDEAEQKAILAVPTQYVAFLANDVIASGEITEDEIARLRAENEAWVAATAAGGGFVQQLDTLARSLLAVLVIAGVTLYMSRYQIAAFRDNRRRVLTSVLLLVVFGLTRWLYVSTDAPPHVAVGSQALATALLAIVATPGVVFAVAAALAVLTTMAVQQGIGFLVILLAVTGVFVFGLREVRNRGRIVTVGFFAALVACAASTCVGLMNGHMMRYSLSLGAWAGGVTLLAAFVIEGVLPVIERLFRLSTGMTLLEWCDGSRPLLRMMAADAPGTYNHSLLVGALAESAAEAIGANGLLCRAGAYYHDIGKINKPEYFVENQAPGVSRHERLSPAMSLLIIVGHVKDGIEMAREYGLPASLVPFIAQHHGTTLVEYFYHAANRLRKPDDREVAEATFRYPGPKPQMRETAIVMLADGVEGAVRAMSEPTPGRIEDVVGEIVRKRLMDGQFDECDLTFKELAEIEKSLIKSLNGIYHARIVYPESEDERKPTVRSAS